jgi:microsomal dipeptidase-like Zn-dependent dipeptidase
MVLKALAKTGGMLGLSLYPHHLRQGSATPLHEFCAMAVEVATIVGVDNLGIGSDLCQGQPDNVVQWMREGRWTRSDPQSAKVAFPAQPDWFRDNRDFVGLAGGLNAAGFSDSDIAKVLGENWQNFMRKAFRPGA